MIESTSRRSLLLVSVVALSACSLVGGLGSTGRRPCPPTRSQQMVQLLNDLRERETLPLLRVDRRLMAAAQAHAEDMAKGGFLGHSGSDGSLPAYRAERERYPWIYVAENTSAGYATAAATFAAWMDSPLHRENNLRAQVEHIGIGYAENGDTQYRSYWVAVFGASLETPISTPGGCHP